jgi:hypothetical protein
MAEIMSQVLGKDVRFQQITFEAYKDRFVRLGMSDAMAQGYTDMAWAKNEGLDNGVQRTRRTRRRPAFANGAKRGSSRRSPRRHRLARNHTRAGHMPASKTSEPHTGRVALVTGAAHGIGQAIAAGLAERATRIVLGDIDDVSEASDLNGQRRALHTVMPATRDGKGATGKGAVGGE